MPERFNVLILGHGEMGHAMAHLLARRHAVSVWQRHPKDGSGPVDLQVAAPKSDAILFCLPTQPHFEIAARLRPWLSHKNVCITIAKGLDDQGRPAAAILREVFASAVPFATLCGPMISEEIRAGKPAFAQVGAEARVYAWVADLFAGTPLFLEHTEDQIGIAWAAVLKNVYAMLFGMADTMGLGDNVRGYLSVAAVREMGKIITAMGGHAQVASLAGLGDLITTATSSGSHHRELGALLARGEHDALRGEGIHTLEMVKMQRIFDATEYPLYRFMERCVFESVDIKREFLRYLQEAHRLLARDK